MAPDARRRGHVAVFFDLDETLYAAERAYARGLGRAWRAWRRLAAPISWEEFVALYDRARADVKRATRDSPSSHNRILYVKRMTELSLGRPVPRVALGAMRAYDRCWGDIPLGPTRRVLAAIARRFLVGVISNQVAATQLLKLERLDPTGRWIRVLVTSEDVDAEKPDPRIFREACARAGCRPDQAYMVGDDWKADVLGAVRVGMTPIYVAPGGRHAPRARPRVITIDRLDDLERVLA